MLVTLFGISVIIFVLLRIVPGNIVDILFDADQGTCWAPYVKNVTIMSNSSYNGFRYEDVWMDK